MGFGSQRSYGTYKKNICLDIFFYVIWFYLSFIWYISQDIIYGEYVYIYVNTSLCINIYFIYLYFSKEFSEPEKIVELHISSKKNYMFFKVTFSSNMIIWFTTLILKKFKDTEKEYSLISTVLLSDERKTGKNRL